MDEAKLRAALQRMNDASVNVEAVLQRAKDDILKELLPALADAYAAMNDAAPAKRRVDYGYFYCDRPQPGETNDHVTLVHCPSAGRDFWNDAGRPRVMETAVTLMQSSRAGGVERAVITLDFCGWDQNGRYLGDTGAAANVDAFIAFLKAWKVLDMVVAAYTVDEPEREANVSAADLTAFCGVTRACFAAENMKPALAIIYGDGTYGGRGRDYRAIGAHDWVGRDAYGEGVRALGEPYADLAARLRPDQGIILPPGVADPWRANLAAWYERAMSDKRVVWLAPFTWVGYEGKPVGARTNGLAAMCREYGLRIKAAA